MHALCILLQQQSKGLSTFLKSKVWKKVFAAIQPIPSHGISIPTVDDFDPDTYGMAVEIPVACKTQYVRAHV